MLQSSSNAGTTFRGSSSRLASPTSSSPFWKKSSNSCAPFSTQQRSQSPLTPQNFAHSSITKNEKMDENSNSPWSQLQSNTSPSIQSPSPPSQASQESSSKQLLLLEGDSYQISRDGIARTLYRMRSANCNGLSIEERYDLHNARKQFLTRQNNDGNDNDNTAQDLRSKSHPARCVEGMVNLGHTIQQITIQEIGDGIANGIGTGSTTWESSIAMSMYFASHPEEARGDVVELGSGVGLGGILCATMAPKLWHDGPKASTTKKSPTTTHQSSITLTDYSPEVLQQCQKNVDAIEQQSLAMSMHVAKLDWYDSQLHETTSLDMKLQQQSAYDTIIACDCAYRRRDIAPLASTMKSLLKNDDSRIHIFAPTNRSGIDELLRLLRDDHQLSVTVKSLEMDRYRLVNVPDGTDSSIKDTKQQQQQHSQPYATSYLSSFLHIVCAPVPKNTEPVKNLSDID